MDAALFKRPLPAKEQIELAVRARAGDAAARDMLVTTTMRAVAYHASRALPLARGRLELDDLVSEGVFGVLRAIELFDPDQGVLFLSYATWWIKNHVRRAAQDAAEVNRADLNRKKYLVDYDAALAEGLGHDAALAVVAERYRSKPETVRRVLAALRRGPTLSLDERVGDDPDSSCFLDFVADPGELQDERVGSDDDLAAVSAAVDRFRATLDARQRDVFERRVWCDPRDRVALREVGARWRVTRERIRQLETRVRKLFSAAVRDDAELHRALGTAPSTPVAIPAPAKPKKEAPKKRPDARVLVVDGVSRTITEWSDVTGISYSAIVGRVDKLGWSPERAVSVDAGLTNRRTRCGRGHDLGEPGSRFPSGGCRACARHRYQTVSPRGDTQRPAPEVPPDGTRPAPGERVELPGGPPEGSRLAARFSATERAELDWAADRAGTTTSEWARSVLLGAAQRVSRVRVA